ncbi:hypothetical protein [Colwellia sp. E2M01]|uniref:hypothetical protein n=1 Tax=Colwellia sp. E2M01 TaxID=2841561 RepID=UPI001C090156|nr:hypothetical protein [Colwellia sp. E2M01]MBU2871973.1 hypothetical protein [Colwellia sp. E2M01]
MSIENTATPVATASAGGLWQSINGGLGDALSLWGQVEQIKADRSTSGQDLQAAVYEPELDNAAAVQVDQSLLAVGAHTKPTTINVNKPLLIASLGLLGLAFYMRMNGAR